MTSKAPDVQAYLEELPADRREVLGRLRDLCKRTLTGYQECMAYGLPGYQRHGKSEIAFASQKGYIALYVMKKEVVDEFRDQLSASIGKGCIRFSKPEKMNFEVIERLLQRTAESHSEPC